ncbi:MAG TPA: hypothetical protein PK547_02010 [Candidatus Paceibacterota bacterium]|nr:hypothetical protein [Candidatus Paceibacterota bacterium]
MDELNKTKREEEEEEEEKDKHEEHEHNGHEHGCQCGCQWDDDKREDKHEGKCHCHGVPDELKRWNWGAFLLSWIWAIGNNVWLGLLALLPYLWLPMAILLGAKGNEWAWEAGHYADLETFKKKQNDWKKAGFTVLIVIGCLYLSLFFWAAIVANSIFWGLVSLFISGH